MRRNRQIARNAVTKDLMVPSIVEDDEFCGGEYTKVGVGGTINDVTMTGTVVTFGGRRRRLSQWRGLEAKGGFSGSSHQER